MTDDKQNGKWPKHWRGERCKARCWILDINQCSGGAIMPKTVKAIRVIVKTVICLEKTL